MFLYQAFHGSNILILKTQLVIVEAICGEAINMWWPLKDVSFDHMLFG